MNSLGERFRALGYTGARRLVLVAGLVVLLLVAALMYARRVEGAEVGGTLLFIPVFVAFIFWDVRGGVVAGVLAALAYAALRYPAIDAVGADRFIGLIAARGLAYLAFGLVGGWANQQLAGSLTKLELYDQIDDATGLYNARFLVEGTDLELARSQRYQTIFSVAILDIPAEIFEGLDRRRTNRLLRDLGGLLNESVRAVDRAVHAFDGRSHRIAVILPETSAEGARVFSARLADRVSTYLAERGAPRARGLVSERSLTLPGDEAALQTVRDEFAAIDRREHPEVQESATGTQKGSS